MAVRPAGTRAQSAASEGRHSGAARGSTPPAECSQMSLLRDTTWQSLPSSVRPFPDLFQCLQASIRPDEVLQRVLPSFPLHSLIRYVNALTELLHISVPTRQHLLKATFREGRRTFTGPVDRKQISTRPHDRRRSVEAILRENPVYAQRQKCSGVFPSSSQTVFGLPPRVCALVATSGSAETRHQPSEHRPSGVFPHVRPDHGCKNRRPESTTPMWQGALLFSYLLLISVTQAQSAPLPRKNASGHSLPRIYLF